MNFDEAIHKHAEWKLKFRSAISRQEQLDTATIAKDNCCVLGNWLHGDGKLKFGTKPEFKAVLDLHKTFHVEAGKVSQLINSKKYAEAEQALGAGTRYGDASNAVGSALIVLKKAAA
jgi:hypothetical protein